MRMEYQMLFTTGIVFNENDWSGEDMIDEDKMRAIETEEYLERRNAPEPVSEHKLDLLQIEFGVGSRDMICITIQKRNGERTNEVVNNIDELTGLLDELLEAHKNG